MMPKVKERPLPARLDETNCAEAVFQLREEAST